MPTVSWSRARPSNGDFASIRAVVSNWSSRLSAASTLSAAMYFQMSLRSLLAVAERRTLANAFQLSRAGFFSGLGLKALPIKIGNPALPYVFHAQANVLPQTIKFEYATLIAIGQQSKRLAHNFTGGLISAFADLALDKSFQLRSEGHVHFVTITSITKISNLCYAAESSQ